MGAVHGDGNTPGRVTEGKVGGDIGDGVERHADGRGALVEVEDAVGSQ